MTSCGLCKGVSFFLHLSHTSHICGRICDIIVTCTQRPILVYNSCNCFTVAEGLLVVSLFSFFLVLSSSLEQCPDLSILYQIYSYVPLLIVDFTVLLGIDKAFETFLYPSPGLLLASATLPVTEMLHESSFHAELI